MNELILPEYFDILLPYFACINNTTNYVSMILPKRFKINFNKIRTVFTSCKTSEFKNAIFIEGKLNSDIVNYLYNKQIQRMFELDNPVESFPYLINFELNFETMCYKNNAIIFPDL